MFDLKLYVGELEDSFENVDEAKKLLDENVDDQDYKIVEDLPPKKERPLAGEAPYLGIPQNGDLEIFHSYESIEEALISLGYNDPSNTGLSTGLD